MVKQYNRVSLDPKEATAQAKHALNRSQASASNISNKTISERLWEKIKAFLWVLFAIFVVRVTDTPKVILFSKHPIRPLLHVAITQLTVNFLLMIYLGVYLAKVKGIKDSQAWAIYCPRVIQFMTINGIITVFTLLRSLWPVWGFLTPLILSIEFVGLLFATNFIPAL